MELAVNTHVRHGTIFSCELDAASRFVVGAQPRGYSGYGKLDVLLGQKRRLTWVLYGWVILMLLGLLLTDLGIFLGWGKVLANLCPLSLGMSGIGYLGTGWAVRSRALLAASLFHLLGILILPYTSGWSFLFTGGVMVFSLLVLAQWQWDMRRPIEYAALAAQQQHLDGEHGRIRQLLT
ncbi:hypothetical protein [Microcoleus sp. PH2017_21_RUC_O_A]|uniref:hypothetical protein n=1 Tax=Microcoleus sp. PH2017_21_RUC_O_A TaxID=2798832 RepID=UPI0025D6AEF8|nr:hypothetical protein [Microcoleus sp. PH2017_21_RUC_O_A]